VATVVTAVARAYDNPQGLEGETIGTYSWRVRTGGTGVYLTAAEARVLRRAVGKLGVGTVQLEGIMPVPVIDEQYLDVAGVGGPILYYHRDEIPS
jgi:hypothetical protein